MGQTDDKFNLWQLTKPTSIDASSSKNQAKYAAVALRQLGCRYFYDDSDRLKFIGRKSLPSFDVNRGSTSSGALRRHDNHRQAHAGNEATKMAKIMAHLRENIQQAAITSGTT